MREAPEKGLFCFSIDYTATPGDVAQDIVSRYVMLVGSFAIETIPDYQIKTLLTLIKAVSD